VALVVGFIVMVVVSGFTCLLCLGPMTVGYSRMCLRAARGGTVEIGDVFSGFSQFGPSFLLMFLFVVMVVIGSALFVLPGMIVALLFFWAPWFMADGDNDPISCLKRSMAYSLANLGPVLVFVLVNALIMNLGHAVGVGGLLTAPVAMAMAAHGFARAFPAAAM
jgi:uncharacterized membrane protein